MTKGGIKPGEREWSNNVERGWMLALELGVGVCAYGWGGLLGLVFMPLSEPNQTIKVRMFLGSEVSIAGLYILAVNIDAS